MQIDKFPKAQRIVEAWINRGLFLFRLQFFVPESLFQERNNSYIGWLWYMFVSALQMSLSIYFGVSFDVSHTLVIYGRRPRPRPPRSWRRCIAIAPYSGPTSTK